MFSRIRPVLLGSFIIALGVVLLLKNFGLLQISVGSLFATYWPVFLIILGVDSLLQGLTERNRSTLTGILVTGLGLAFLGRNLGFFDFDFSIVWKLFWPAVLILMGWSLIRGVAGPGGNHWAVMGGIEMKQRGWKLENAGYIAIMGGISLDIYAADMPDQTVNLNLTALMGGVEVRVPPGFSVEYTGTAILGGINFLGEEGGGIIASRRGAHKGEPDSGKKIIISSRTIMGGIDIKH